MQGSVTSHVWQHSKLRVNAQQQLQPAQRQDGSVRKHRQRGGLHRCAAPVHFKVTECVGCLATNGLTDTDKSRQTFFVLSLSCHHFRHFATFSRLAQCLGLYTCAVLVSGPHPKQQLSGSSGSGSHRTADRRCPASNRLPAALHAKPRLRTCTTASCLCLTARLSTWRPSTSTTFSDRTAPDAMSWPSSPTRPSAAHVRTQVHEHVGACKYGQHGSVAHHHSWLSNPDTAAVCANAPPQLFSNILRTYRTHKHLTQCTAFHHQQSSTAVIRLNAVAACTWHPQPQRMPPTEAVAGTAGAACHLPTCLPACSPAQSNSLWSGPPSRTRTSTSSACSYGR